MAIHIRRREFIVALGSAATWPLAALAQQAERMRRIGLLLAAYTQADREGQTRIAAFLDTLHRLRWTDGRNIQIDYRWAGGDTDRGYSFAKELVRSAPDVIVVNGYPALAELHRLTSTISIVFTQVSDPVGSGLVAGLARPGGNVTGMSVQMAEQEGKRLELLKKLLPNFSRLAVLSNPTNPYCAIAVGEARRGAAALNLQFEVVEASDAPSLEAAFLSLSRIRPDAVLVVADPFLAGERVRIADQMIKEKLPSIYSYHEHVRAGGLMTYTTNYYDVFRRQGLFIDKIFKGAKPGDLPVQQPTKFELMLNLKTAKALGLTIPPTLLAIADEVIE